MNRRNSSPSIPVPPGEVHAQRRHGGTRREATERILIRGEGFETEGWTLNVSRGGARVVVEEPVEPGVHYQLSVGPDASDGDREVRIVWVQDEPDGQIVGVQFMDVDGSVPPPPSSTAHDKPPKG